MAIATYLSMGLAHKSRQFIYDTIYKKKGAQATAGRGRPTNARTTKLRGSRLLKLSLPPPMPPCHITPVGSTCTLLK